MQHLFPALPGMKKYEKALRGITSESNGLLLQIVEDLSYVFSDGRENRWDPDEVQKERKRFLADLLAMRDTFVYRHEVILLDALERDAAPNVSHHLERVALARMRRLERSHPRIIRIRIQCSSRTLIFPSGW